MAQQPPSPLTRPVGLETEFGVLEPGSPDADAVTMSSRIVQAYAVDSRGGLTSADGTLAGPVRWDYEAEDPLADLRGGRLTRSAAHPSLLTDDPACPAPSGEGPTHRGTSGSPGAIALRPGQRGPVQDQTSDDPPPAPWGRRPRPGGVRSGLSGVTTAVLTNGGRLYVDHAHPEYSTPEVLTPLDALIWDRAGELIAQRAMRSLLHSQGGELVLYKNNVDGKGAAYGTHENYLVSRDLPWETLAAALVPFLVTRPAIVGAGRVGIGQRSQEAGFQLAQRADYVETVLGLQTTFNRPIVNTRDEPHADARRFRRLHVINGDATMMDVPSFLKIATTSLLLWLLERNNARGLGLGDLATLRLAGDPVEELWKLSHDTALRHQLVTDRGPMTALEIQRAHLQAVRTALTEDFGGQEAEHVGEQTTQALALWEEVLTSLEAYRGAVGSSRQAPCLATAARLVEWAAKLQVCEAMRSRDGLAWDDPRLAALDLQWADCRPGRGVARTLVQAGRTRRLVTDQQVEQAVETPPAGTRAWLRGRAVAEISQLVGASWTSLVLDLPGHGGLLRMTLPGEVAMDEGTGMGLMDALRDTIGSDPHQRQD